MRCFKGRLACEKPTMECLGEEQKVVKWGIKVDWGITSQKVKKKGDKRLVMYKQADGHDTNLAYPRDWLPQHVVSY